MTPDSNGDSPFAGLAGIDRLVHSPARLAILTALSTCASADFTYLLSLTGLTKGNLSANLARLDEAGLVAIDKRWQGRKPRTSVHLTDEGRRAIDAYWREMDRAREAGRTFRPVIEDEQGDGTP